MQSTLHCTETLPLMPLANFSHFISLATHIILSVAQCEHTIKVCLHVPSPYSSKFNIVPMVMNRLTDRIGAEPILSFKRSVSIDIMLNIDGDGKGVCKQTITVIFAVVFTSCERAQETMWLKIIHNRKVL